MTRRDGDCLPFLEENQIEKNAGFSTGVFQWAHMDSNHGPRPYQGRALTKLSYAPNVQDRLRRAHYIARS